MFIHHTLDALADKHKIPYIATSIFTYPVNVRKNAHLYLRHSTLETLFESWYHEGTRHFLGPILRSPNSNPCTAARLRHGFFYRYDANYC
jgi:hypothetical protein